MTQAQDLLALAERVVSRFGYDNALDVEVEIALFEPDDEFMSIRANAAGTKVICTTVGGSDMTFWAQEWTKHRLEVAAALRARALAHASKGGGE
jgi:hypothetical protein